MWDLARMRPDQKGTWSEWDLVRMGSGQKTIGEVQLRQGRAFKKLWAVM